MVQMLPGRYVPSTRTLHKYPATEQCNLDDTDAEQKVESWTDIGAIPPGAHLCQFCYTGGDRDDALAIWQEHHGPEEGFVPTPMPDEAGQ